MHACTTCMYFCIDVLLLLSMQAGTPVVSVDAFHQEPSTGRTVIELRQNVPDSKVQPPLPLHIPLKVRDFEESSRDGPTFSVRRLVSSITLRNCSYYFVSYPFSLYIYFCFEPLSFKRLNSVPPAPLNSKPSPHPLAATRLYLPI